MKINFKYIIIMPRDMKEKCAQLEGLKIELENLTPKLTFNN